VRCVSASGVSRLVASILVVAAVSVPGCGGSDDDEQSQQATETVQLGTETETIALEEQSGSGQSGTATLTGGRGRHTKVEIELANSPGDAQPAHIHSGTCEQLGNIDYPLTDVRDGASETVVNESLSHLLGASDAAFAINVHRSAGELDTYVACGTVSQGLPEFEP
jgi:hypothetical protein